MWREIERRADKGEKEAVLDRMRRDALGDKLVRVEKVIAREILPRMGTMLERLNGGVPARGAGDVRATTPQARRHLRSKANPQRMTEEEWLVEIAELSRQHGIQNGQQWDDVFASRPGFPSRKRVSAWLTKHHGVTVNGKRIWPEDRGRGRSKQWDWMLRNL